MRDPGETLGVIEPPVEHVDFVDELVEALEHGVELAVFEGLALGHASDSTLGYLAQRRARTKTRTPIRTPVESIATSIGEECRPVTKCWWISSVIA
jgi:hypothetical protein